jgi:hypothetical protein
MFTFGLFSTHMPYVVMVAVYALYFLFASPTVAPVIENIPVVEDEITELVQNCKTPTQSVTHWYFQVYSEDRNTSSSLKIPDIEIYYTPPDIKPIQDGFTSFHYSRPPPVVS